MISLYNTLFVLLVHWVADFILQPDHVAKAKSTSNKALTSHIFTYTFVLFSGVILLSSPIQAATYSILNGTLHFCIDYVTSRWTKKLYLAGDSHTFFVVIGLDQLLHTALLLATMRLL